jgi:hypothetical protein
VLLTTDVSSYSASTEGQHPPSATAETRAGGPAGASACMLDRARAEGKMNQ